MRKNNIRNVIINIAEDTDIHALADRVSAFHAEIIERKLKQSNFTAEEKIAIIDRIVDELKSRNDNGLIK